MVIKKTNVLAAFMRAFFRFQGLENLKVAEVVG